MNIDYNCFVGTWPFIKRRQTDFAGLRSMHEEHKIETGYVSSLGAVYYNDPFEGDLELAHMIKGSKYRHAVSINPLLPHNSYDINRADEAFEYDAFRVYPTVHGYDFDALQFRQFFHMAERREKPVLIHCTFGDFRLDYILKQKAFELDSLVSFLKLDLSVPVVLCNIRLPEIAYIAETIRSKDNLYIDMSEMRHSMFAVDNMEKSGLSDRLVFGSFYPVFDFRAAYMHFDGCSDKIVNSILNREINLTEVR